MFGTAIKRQMPMYNEETMPVIIDKTWRISQGNKSIGRLFFVADTKTKMIAVTKKMVEIIRPINLKEIIPPSTDRDK